MYSENVTIVDVTGGTQETRVALPSELSMPAGELYVAAKNGCVIRRNDVSETHSKYVDLCGAEYDEETGTYTFTFVGGDEYTATSPDEYPTGSSSITDFDGTGGGGVLVVHSSDDDNPVLDKTWQEIHDAALPVINGDGLRYILNDYTDGDNYQVFYEANGAEIMFVASSANGYPVMQNNV